MFLGLSRVVWRLRQLTRKSKVFFYKIAIRAPTTQGILSTTAEIHSKILLNRHHCALSKSCRSWGIEQDTEKAIQKSIQSSVISSRRALPRSRQLATHRERFFSNSSRNNCFFSMFREFYLSQNSWQNTAKSFWHKIF